jgi:phage terminase large subunit-like protein
MQAGPKAAPLNRPLPLSKLPKTGGARVVALVEQFVRVPKGKGARKPFRVRPWQRDLIAGVFEQPRPRMALWSLPRGNGKSALAATLGLYGLFGDDVEGASVVVARDERQARIVFGAAVLMCELSEPLARRVQFFHDRLYIPRTGSTFQVLPAEAHRLEGLDPSLAIADEIGVVDRAVYEAVNGATGKRADSLLLMIGTPSPDGVESVMWDLVAYGRENPGDHSFRLVEYAAPEGCDLDDEATWEVANPALDDILHRDGVRATLPPKLRESTFRRYRLGQWTEAVDEPWIAAELWAACADVPICATSVGPTVVVRSARSMRRRRVQIGRYGAVHTCLR